MEKQQKDVTIKDVARRADVAISTVSRVLNGLDKVRPRQGSGSGRPCGSWAMCQTAWQSPW